MALTQQFRITSPLGPQEVLAVIQPLLIHPDTVAERAFASMETASDDSGLTDRYLGATDPGGFRLVRPTFGSPNLRPEATGIVRSSHVGSEIQVRISPTPPTVRLLGVLSFLILALTALFSVFVLPGSLVWLIGVLAVPVAWGSLAFGVHNDARRLRNRLTAILNTGA